MSSRIDRPFLVPKHDFTRLRQSARSDQRLGDQILRLLAGAFPAEMQDIGTRLVALGMRIVADADQNRKRIVAARLAKLADLRGVERAEAGETLVVFPAGAASSEDRFPAPSARYRGLFRSRAPELRPLRRSAPPRPIASKLGRSYF